MATTLQLKFDPNQKHQLEAVESVAGLFAGLPRAAVEFALGDEVVANLPPFETLNDSWLAANLRKVQSANGVTPAFLDQFEVENGVVLEGAGYESHRYPSFTIEMETGTGKTYVYLRTLYELRRRYGFSKFIIVVPSLAIYEGVIKNFQITQSHFRALYSNETVNLLAYDGGRLSQLRGFAASSFVEVMVITLDAFNKPTNTIYKPSEKLPGERRPYQYVQETRPILILDEPQNMESERARQALRSLHPLFALRYSATHRSSPNLVYRLSPFDAYRLNLVKKIQVFGVTERENFNHPFLALEETARLGGGRDGIRAKVKTYVLAQGKLRQATVELKHGDDLYSKTHREEYQAGYRVVEINAAANFIEFENGLRLQAHETIGPSRPEIFRAQIAKTIEQHMELQQRMQRRGVKVLSLFFIDRVANYTAPEGLIRRIFDEEFERLKGCYPFFAERRAADVRQAYFAKKKARSGEEEAIDTESRTQAEREAEKAAFELIMKDKERLLSFDEKTAFIFAHSALKEGWDNPNVFQICTLNQTVSEIKKRQEIGRGLRLAVDQQGERVFDDEVNLLSVIANESYHAYAAGLQQEYRESGDAAPPPPRDGFKQPARRSETVFAAQAFRDFWAKMQQRTSYRITIDTPQLIETCIERLDNQPTPQAVIVIEKGAFVVAEFRLRLEAVNGAKCRLRVSIRDTDDQESIFTHTFPDNANLGERLNDKRLQNLRVVKIEGAGGAARVLFSNGQALRLSQEMEYQTELGQQVSEKAVMAPREAYPVFNLIDRAAKETGLTRPTVNAIFKGLSERKKGAIFANPEGFAGQFIAEISNALADHIAERIQFFVEAPGLDWGYDLDDLFPPEKVFPQKELIDSGPAGLYDQTQVDSDVEKQFVRYRLMEDRQVVCYFKFPPSFKIQFPKILGNYNPDWGIARYGPDGKTVLELVRETKGQQDLAKLRFPNEKRKILCARKHFAAIGIDYRVVADQALEWWKAEEEAPRQERFEI